jgi:hypothetical protein
MQRQTAAAVESFRNEMAQTNKDILALTENKQITIEAKTI